jgi:hypothetical protein
VHAHVPIGAEYTLSPEETAVCVRLGRERNAKNVEQRRRNCNYSGRPDVDISIQGLFGELAFCRLFRLPIEIWDTSCRSARTETRFDAVFPCGLRVDVKTTLYDDADLRIPIWKAANPPDLYALLIHTNSARDRPIDDEQLRPTPTLSFRGLVASRDALQPRNLRRVAERGARWSHYYIVPQSDLRTFDAIWLDIERDGLPTHALRADPF